MLSRCIMESLVSHFLQESVSTVFWNFIKRNIFRGVERRDTNLRSV